MPSSCRLELNYLYKLPKKAVSHQTRLITGRHKADLVRGGEGSTSSAWRAR